MSFTGIDKTVVKGFSIESIDFKKLEQSGKALVVRATNKSLYSTMGGKSFEYIKITDEELFRSFKAGIKINGNVVVRYTFLDISIAPLNENNLTPLSIIAYKSRLSKIFTYIQNRYGIRCGELKDIKFETLELNTTLQLDHDFNDYVRVFRTLMNIAPKTYRIDAPVGNRQTETQDTFVIKNKSLAVKFYNKSKQMQEVYKIDAENNLLRVEYTFLKDDKITNVFGTNKVNEISDTDIKDCIKNRFTYDFIQNYYKLKDKNKKQMIKLITNYKKGYKNWICKMKDCFWQTEADRQTPLLLDTCEFLDLVRQEDSKNYAKNKSRILNNFPSTYLNQSKKYEEIFAKIMAI